MQTLFQRALKRDSQPTPPIWMMRQAGRYHKHYQALRAKHSFIDLCKKADLAAEVAMGPIRDFDFDAAILFSDLLYPLEVLGMPLVYDPGPKLGWHLESETQLATFKRVAEAIKGMDFQAEALEKTRALLPKEKSLIGFVGGPWTLFVYAVEGSHQGELKKSLESKALYEKFSQIMMPFLKKNIELQLNAGAELVMIFDTAAGEVNSDFFAKNLVPQLKELFSERVGYYMKNGTLEHYKALEGAKVAGLGYDHHFDLGERLKNSRQGFVQGNFNQNHLTLAPADFQKEFHKYVEQMQKLKSEERAGWVAGLGHGITPQAKEENVKYFVEGIRKAFK